MTHPIDVDDYRWRNSPLPTDPPLRFIEVLAKDTDGAISEVFELEGPSTILSYASTSRQNYNHKDFDPKWAFKIVIHKSHLHQPTKWWWRPRKDPTQELLELELENKEA